MGFLINSAIYGIEAAISVARVINGLKGHPILATFDRMAPTDTTTRTKPSRNLSDKPILCHLIPSSHPIRRDGRQGARSVPLDGWVDNTSFRITCMVFPGLLS